MIILWSALSAELLQRGLRGIL
jgi:hypothetical protein